MSDLSSNSDPSGVDCRHPATGGRQAGLFDMHGNAWEWVQDGWGADSYARLPETLAINPGVPFSGNSERVVRGGFSNDSAYICRAATRAPDGAELRYKHIGFRVMLPVDAVKSPRSAR